MKITALSFMAPFGSAATFEAVESTKVSHPIKVLPIVRIDVAGGLVPPTSMSSLAKGCPIKREEGEEKKKKKKSTIMKVQCKARPSRSNDNDNLEGSPFNTPNTIPELVDRFALSKVIDQMVYLDDAQLTWDSLGTFFQENLQTEVDRLQDRIAKADYHLKEKKTDIGVLQEALQKGELILVGSQAALALEEKMRKRIEVRIAELKDETSRQISETKVQVVKELKVLFDMMDLNIAFSQEAFQKGYELYKDRVDGMFPKLDLDFLC
ncbi:hypothetical protein COCNU_scaffold000542G000020 [Cocos nucifera]|nr:hypothetical protein [Cocos nucifera]